MKTIGAALVQAVLGLVVMLGVVAIVIATAFSMLVYGLMIVFGLPVLILERVRKWISSRTV